MFSSPSWSRFTPDAGFDAGQACICSNTELNLSRMPRAVSFWFDKLLIFPNSDLDLSRENLLAPMIFKLGTGGEPSAK